MSEKDEKKKSSPKAISTVKSRLKRAEQLLEEIAQLCSIPSPTGYTSEAAAYIKQSLLDLGFKPWERRKGGIFCELSLAENSPPATEQDDALLLSAHMDTLGLMVQSIKSDGRLKLSRVGGFPWNYVEQENVVLMTRAKKRFEGSVHLLNPAVHANNEVGEAKRSAANLELVLDEKVSSKTEVQKLGIRPGDFVFLDARATVTKAGFLKSRHLDDKASCVLLLELARLVAQGLLQPCRRTYILFTNYEEVGHGAAGPYPLGISDMLAVDMGVVGDDLETDEFKLSICAKDSSGPYNFAFTNELINLATKKKLNFAVDVYPFYGSDCSAALGTGLDVRHALIGPGVAASHGYERIHKEGLAHTLGLLEAVLQGPKA